MSLDTPTRWYRSADGRTLYVDQAHEGGTLTSTFHWDFDPSDELIATAVEGVRTRTDGLCDDGGGSFKMKRIGNTVFEINVGPPTWWIPKVEIERTETGHWSFRIGWLRCAVGAWRCDSRNIES